MSQETKAHEIVLRFCRWDGTTRLFGGHYGMREPRNPNPGAKCIICCLDWTERPNLAEANTWEQVYVQLAVSGALDLARVETEACREQERIDREGTGFLASTKYRKRRHYRR